MRPVNLKHAKDKLCSIQKEHWNRDIASQDKMRTYRTFKNMFNTEIYVKCSMSRSERSFVSQLRFGILPLGIETGRYTQPKTPIEERICHICNDNKIEDENHFIFDKTYSKRRELFLQNNKNITFKDIFKDTKLLRQFAAYLQDIFYQRRNILFKV